MKTLVGKNMLIRALSGILLLGTLAGCGADVAATAVTVTKLQAEQNEQARSQEALVREKLNEAVQAAHAAASAADAQ